MISSLCITLVALWAQPPAEVPGLTQRLLGMPEKTPTALADDVRSAAVPLRTLGQTVWALTLAGQETEAGKLAEFGLSALETTAQAERPNGSVAPEVLGDAKAVLPRCFMDAHAVSAVLEATWRHASSLPEAARAPWIERNWPKIEAGADFVVGWTRGARGEPYAAYEPTLGHDSGGPRESMGALLGVLCAQALAEAAGKDLPETWTQRREALEILVRTTDFSASMSAPWGPAALRGILPDDHPLWNTKVRDAGAEWTVRSLAWREPSALGPRWEHQPEQVLIALLAPKPADIEAAVQATLLAWRERRAGTAPKL